MIFLKRSYVILNLFLFASVPATAATLPKSDQKCNVYSVGIEGFYYRYREPNVMKMRGFLYGLNGAYNRTFGSDFFLQPDLRFDYGRTNYKSYRTGSLKHEPNWLFETRMILGKHLCASQEFQWDPFIGLGYRYKADDTDGMSSTTGHKGYFRSSQYLYIPVGLTLHYRLCNGWALAPTVEFDWFIHGWQRSDLFAGTLHHTQKKGYGLRGEFMVNKQFNNGCISIGPFINYWAIDDSNVVKNAFGISYIEPNNKSLETGLKIKYAF